RVDLPLPEGPSTAVMLPRGTARSSPDRIVRPPRSRRTPERRTAMASCSAKSGTWARTAVRPGTRRRATGKAWPTVAESRRSAELCTGTPPGGRADAGRRMERRVSWSATRLRHNRRDGSRTGIPPLPLQLARGVGGRAGRAPARAAPGRGLDAPRRRAGAAVRDAALAAAVPGGARGDLRQPALPDPWRVRGLRARCQPRRGAGGRAPGAGGLALAPAAPAAGGAAGRLRRTARPGRPAARLAAGLRAGRRVREVPGLAARPAAAVGSRRRPRRPAGAAVARGRGRPRTPRAPHRRIPAAVRRRD